MFPPVEDAVLQGNPDFAALYNTLTTAILNPNGSTKNDPAIKERDVVREELKKHRLKAARQHLLVQAVAAATPPETKPQPKSSRARSQTQPQQLPEPLLDLLLLLPPLLQSPQSLSPESMTLLLTSPPFSSFQTLLPKLGPLVSSALHTSAVSLARLANPTTNPSFLHRSVPTLPQTYASLAESMQVSAAELSRARLSTVSALTTLLQRHAKALTLLIRTLEAKHGVVARSLEHRAAEMALVAKRGEADAQLARWNVHKEVYTPEVVGALRNYAAHLRDARMRAEESIRMLGAELEGYGVGLEGGEGKERTMREMARVYTEMGRQLAETKGDLERLGKA